MDVVFAAAAMHSCKDLSRGNPTPHSHRRDQGICERNTLQIAGSGVCEETREARRPVAGETR